MKAADLHESVAFDAPTQNPDGYGGVEVGWAERFRARAHFRWLRGGETVQAARLAGKQPVVVTLRVSSDSLAITTGWRMRDLRRGVTYNIRSVVPTTDRRMVEVTAESGVAV